MAHWNINQLWTYQLLWPLKMALSRRSLSKLIRLGYNRFPVKWRWNILGTAPDSRLLMRRRNRVNFNRQSLKAAFSRKFSDQMMVRILYSFILSYSVPSLGMFDIKEFTAIINPSQSAILAVGAVSLSQRSECWQEVMLIDFLTPTHRLTILPFINFEFITIGF